MKIVSNFGKLAISFILSITCHTMFAQSYSVKYIHAKADSVIRAHIGTSIPVKYGITKYVLNYQYTKGKSKKIRIGQWLTYEAKDTTKGNFRGAEIIYQIYFKDEYKVGWKRFRLPADTIQIDAVFHLATPLKMGEIPQYIINGDTTKFITYQQASQIIKDKFPVNRNTKEIQEHYYTLTYVPYLKVFPEPMVGYESELLFERNTLRYHWQVTQRIRCASVEGFIESIEEKTMKEFGNIYNSKDLKREFYIDALTGEIIKQGYFIPCELLW